MTNFAPVFDWGWQRATDLPNCQRSSKMNASILLSPGSGVSFVDPPDRFPGCAGGFTG